jgi:hypothetical protein
LWHGPSFIFLLGYLVILFQLRNFVVWNVIERRMCLVKMQKRDFYIPEICLRKIMISETI